MHLRTVWSGLNIWIVVFLLSGHQELQWFNCCAVWMETVPPYLLLGAHVVLYVSFTVILQSLAWNLLCHLLKKQRHLVLRLVTALHGCHTVPCDGLQSELDKTLVWISDSFEVVVSKWIDFVTAQTNLVWWGWGWGQKLYFSHFLYFSHTPLRKTALTRKLCCAPWGKQ